jgi:hypothetical protein
MIQAGSPTGPVKIGYGDAQGRLTDCQVGNHLELKLIRQFEGGWPEERALHDRFSDLWIRGEWHNFSRTMLGDIGLVEIVAPSVDMPAVPSKGLPIAFVVRAAGGSSALARHLGIAQQGISQWKRVPAGHVRAIEALTGLQRHEIRPDLYDTPLAAA